MSYHTVLGYADNPIITLYQDKYEEKLLKIFNSLEISAKLKENFLSLWDVNVRKFLLHPDHSSLLRSVHLSKDFEIQFIWELENFCNWNIQNLTAHQWENIPGTDIKLTLHDNNPSKNEISHPDHDSDDGMLWWWDRSEMEWLEVFWKSFTLLKSINLDFYNELNFIIKKIVPMKTSVNVHNSCSFSWCIGSLYLGYTIETKDPEVAILEALIHESSHNKLNLIMQSETLHVNDNSLHYYSPYRPDARHIQWVLLWVHAIVPTVYCIIQAIHGWYIEKDPWMEKAVLYHIKNKLGYNVLQRHAKFTAIGQKIYQDMGKVILLCDTMIKNYPEFKELNLWAIQSRAKEHFLDVKQNYPYLQY